MRILPPEPGKHAVIFLAESDEDEQLCRTLFLAVKANPCIFATQIRSIADKYLNLQLEEAE